MRRVTPPQSGPLALVLVAWLSACAHPPAVLRDPPEVEQYRMRITKVRNAIDDTRSVLAASRGAAYAPELQMRLAELLSEEARYHYYVVRERAEGRTDGLQVPQVRALKEEAVATYLGILKRSPDTDLADRILFNVAQEQRELGLFTEMCATLERLVREHPTSTYRAEALLVLGDYAFDQSALGPARAYYEQIGALGPGPLRGLAWYKLGWVHVNEGDCGQALSRFEAAIEAARVEGRTSTEPPARTRLGDEFAIPPPEAEGPGFAGHAAVDVEREALVDLTYCYAQVRKPEDAVRYLAARASSREAYVAALSKLARRFAMIEQPKGTAEVARELLRLAPDEPDRLDDARLLHGTLVRMEDYARVGDDVGLILHVFRRRELDLALDEEGHAQLEREFEALARDLATRSHKVLLDGQTLRTGNAWTSLPAQADQTALAYRTYLEAFPGTEHRLEIVANLAEVLVDAGRAVEAGDRYREAAELRLRPTPVTEDAAAPGPVGTRIDDLYNAVAAYQQGLDAADTLDHAARTAARAGLRAAGGAWLTEGAPDPERARKVKFAIAQSFFDEADYARAIDLLTAVAYEYPGTPQGDAAAHLVLGAYDNLDDIGTLIAVGRRFAAPESPISAAVKGQIGPILAAAEQRRLDDLSLAAAGDQPGGLDVLLAFADRYQGSDLGSRALLNTFLAARAAGDAPRLYDLGSQILQRYPNDPEVAGISSVLGQTAAARAEYDRALGYFEDAAKRDESQGPSVLLVSGSLREQLGDAAGAAKDYGSAARLAGRGPARAEAAARLGDLAERTGSPDAVLRALSPLAEPPEPEVQSRVGLALLRLGRTDDAEVALRSVVEAAGASSPGASARANYGLAEVMLRSLESYQPMADLSALEEAIGLVDVTLQSYVVAARQGDATYSVAALARLARAAEVGARVFERFPLPDGISADESALVRSALADRSKELHATAADALAECARRARAAHLLDGSARACLAGEAPAQDPVHASRLGPRTGGASPGGLDAARDRLARDPGDLEALREVGTAYLEAGDAHVARLVLARAAEAGGGGDDLNRLGVASHRCGDEAGALDAFARAADAGSGAGALNLAAMYREAGFPAVADEILAAGPKADGALIGGGSP